MFKTTEFLLFARWVLVAVLEILAGLYLMGEPNDLVATAGAAFVVFGVFSIAVLTATEFEIKKGLK